MAVQAQFGGLAGCSPPLWGDEQLQALLLSAAAGGSKASYWHAAPGAPGGVASAAQSELTCNGGVAAAAASRKRGRPEGGDEQHVSSSSSPSYAALLPIPPVVMQQQHELPAASTSGRVAGALVAELCRQGAEVDALVRAECERLREGLERARKRQRQALARAVAAGAARALREKEAALEAARRRAAELEERLRQAAAESQAWCGLARSNEAVASGLRATLDSLLLRSSVAAPAAAEEGFGESDDPAAVGAADQDALSCCFVELEPSSHSPVASKSSSNSRWACRACGAGEASVLVLPCRHLCLCKACEPRLDACPVCLAAKNASIHVAAAV